MEEKIKIILNKIIYDKLNLYEIEKNFDSNGIKRKITESENNNESMSNFFFIMNDVYLNRLTVQELEYITNSINQLDFSKLQISKELCDFLLSVINKLLLPETSEKYLYWGNRNYEYMAPSDSIVLSFHYRKYILEDEKEIERQEQIINNNINFIQEKLGPLNNLKVSVIVFNEVMNIKSRVI